MRKTLFFMMILAVLATGCKNNKKSKSLNYSDSNPISMVLQGNHQIAASSDYDISYSAINSDPHIEVITVSGSGNIYGKNVGNAKVSLSNGYEEMTVDVNVALFTQPTFEFGCSSERIRALYGRPYNSGYNPEGKLVYQYTGSQGYSYACGEMDFFFNNGAYEESDVYIRPSVSYLLNNYLTENFNHYADINDTIPISETQDTIITLSVYKYKQDENIICGKRLALNQWNEILLFYFRNDPEKALDNSLKMRPRSSKFLY